MKHFFINCVSSDGKVSSKRFITLLAFVMMAIGFLANLFWDCTIDTEIYDSMKWIVVSGLGFTATEQFSNKPIPKNNNLLTEEKKLINGD